MTALDVTVKLLIDFTHESLPTYQTLSPARQHELRVWLWERMFGEGQTVLSEVAGSEAWRPSNVEAQPGSGRPSHEQVHAIAALALSELNGHDLPYSFSIPGSSEHPHEELQTEELEPLPPYHCVRWVVDAQGKLVQVYNYAVALTPSGESTASTEIRVSDTLGTVGELTARVHIAIECVVP